MQIVSGQRRRRKSSRAAGIPRPRRTSNEIKKVDYTCDTSLSLSDDEATPAKIQESRQSEEFALLSGGPHQFV